LRATATLALLLLSTCAKPEAAATPDIEAQARRFVALALEVGRQAPAEIDSYVGPEDLKPAVAAPQRSLAALQADIARLQRDMVAPDPDPRRRRLQERTQRLGALVEVMGSAAPLLFDVEAQRLYGLDSAPVDEARFAAARAALDHLLPGNAPLSARVEAFRARYIVPEGLRPALFARAIAKCRAQTLRHWPLPVGERLDVDWRADAGAAWHRYLGGYRSRLIINPQAVAFLGSIVDVACHEGYPGHHAQFVIAEAAVVGGLPVEDRLVLLRSPGSVVREGAADQGVGIALPPAERLAFDRDLLFPMAGFQPGEAARFEAIRARLDDLAPAALPVLRAYRDGRIDAETAAAALESKALIASPAALLGFVDHFGAYVAGYTGVRDQVRAIVDAGSISPVALRWARLQCVLHLADAVPLGQIAKAVSASGEAGCRPAVAVAPSSPGR
jgi:hypothetical protein